MKEYGGYIPLELNYGKEFYFEYNPMRFNCARSALLHVLKSGKFKKVYLPYYLCESVKVAVERLDIQTEYYNINILLQPEINSIEKEAIILITNYFGVLANKESYTDKYDNVIFDNTQAFFQTPIFKEGVYNIYSLRKFVGVCDGAYLIGAHIEHSEYDEYIPQYADYLTGAIVFGTNQCYAQELENEKQLEQSPVLGISKLSSRIAKSVDYVYVQDKRKQNYEILKTRLSKYNQMNFEWSGEGCPMVYPFLYHDKKMRKKLVDNKIYVPQWWKHVLDIEEANRYERELSEFLLPLPIDQRYSCSDMEDLARIVNRLKEG